MNDARFSRPPAPDTSRWNPVQQPELSRIGHNGADRGINNSMNVKYIPATGIPEETPLWRYMKLSTFFLILKGKVFIPSLRKLQESDPKEMRILEHSVMPLGDPFLNSPEFLNAKDWLKAQYRSRTRVDLDRHLDDENVKDVLLLKEWIHQLGARRCAWCWFEPTDWCDSMAMWSLYARDGVAVKTTLKSVLSAIDEDQLKEVLVARVRCHRQGDQLPTPDDEAVARRPFILKHGAYRHEQEVRVVFKLNPASGIAGVKINVDPNKLVSPNGEIVLSPFIIADEAHALCEAVKGQLGADIRVSQSSDLSEAPGDPTEYVDYRDKLVAGFHPLGAENGLPDLLKSL